MAGNIYAGKWGHTHSITVRDENGALVDVSAATSREMCFRQDGGEIITVTAAAVPGNNYVVRYKVPESSPVDAAAGIWTRWAVTTFGDGSFITTPEKYRVHEPGT